MNSACDKCYESRQPHTMKCPNCGKNTYVGQVIGICSVWECSSCGDGVVSAGGFPPACYSNELYEIFIEKPTDNGSMVKLARILNRNVLELYSNFSESSAIKLSMKVLDCVKTWLPDIWSSGSRSSPFAILLLIGFCGSHAIKEMLCRAEKVFGFADSRKSYAFVIICKFRLVRLFPVPPEIPHVNTGRSRHRAFVL